MLAIGSTAPDFTLPDSDGGAFRLRDQLARGPLVLYFYPKDGTPTCTAQACMVRDRFEELSKAGITVVGVNADSGERHDRFAAKHSLPFTLLSDPKHEAVKLYGASAIFGWMTRRISYFIDADGRILDRAAADWSVKPHEQFIERVLSRQGDIG